MICFVVPLQINGATVCYTTQDPRGAGIYNVFFLCPPWGAWGIVPFEMGNPAEGHPSPMGIGPVWIAAFEGSTGWVSPR